MSQLLTQLQTAFPELDFQANWPLGKKSYFKLGGPAEVYLEVAAEDQALEVIRFCQENKLKLTVIGHASNVIVSDEGVSGLVIHFKNETLKKLEEKTADGTDLLRAGAGLRTASLVRQSVEMGYTGLEFFLGVPGTVGGAVYNSSHYLEQLITQYVYRVRIVNEAGQLETLSHDDCQFDYDSSRFQKTNEIILSADFALKPGDKAASEKLLKESTQYRTRTQPLGLPSSGCIFKNVPNTPRLKEMFPQFADSTHVPAGFLIDQAGLKGTQLGQLEVSEKHASFMINRGGGTTQQLKELIKLVKNRVQAKFDVELTEEVFYLS